MRIFWSGPPLWVAIFLPGMDIDKKFLKNDLFLRSNSFLVEAVTSLGLGLGAQTSRCVRSPSCPAAGRGAV